MALKTLETPFKSTDLVKDLNDNFTDLDTNKANTSALSDYIPTTQKGTANGVASLDADSKVNQTAKNADMAKDYDTSTGTIKTKIATIEGNITNIENGTTAVGKAKALNPDTPPGNDKYYGTSASGTIGWYDYDDGSGSATGVIIENFTDVDARWSTISGGLYTLTIPHTNKYPLGVFKVNGSDYDNVNVDIIRNNTNVLVRSHNKFTGYLQLG